MRLGRKNKKTESIKTVQTVLRETRNNSPIFSRFAVQTRTERQLYTTLRESVPIIDAALCKIIRLIGGFKIVTSSAESQKIADSFVKNVRTNGEMMGLESFVLCYLDSLLTYGQAVGEIVPDSGGEGICALYNASLDDVEIRADSSPLKLAVYTLGNGTAEEPKHPERIFATLLNPKPGTVCGTSILSGLPFVSSILLRIFESVKTNWERVGDIRFAVTLNPDSNGSAVSRENAQADILTSELAYYRTVLEPVITKIVSAHLKMCGYNDSFKIEWDKINLQDAVELSQARLNNANAMNIERQIGAEVQNEG